MVSKTKPGWHEGPPPSIGWWPASNHCDPNILRWWDGKCWSVAMYATERDPDYAGYWAKIKNTGKEKIYWTERPAHWPERSKT